MTYKKTCSLIYSRLALVKGEKISNLAMYRWNVARKNEMEKVLQISSTAPLG